MTINKRKKNSRQRGSHTCGWGTKKHHRGSGSRGGFGNAGSGKRADTKMPSLWAERWQGKHGFVNQRRKELGTINISELEQKLPKLVEDKKAKIEAGIYVIDLGALGIGKLLGSGKLGIKVKVAVDSASKNAVEAVKEAGGEVITAAKKE
ncbi:MAG: uL15 family ribosomal protein [Candidatus Woesearchaeota archaeon]